eukprot:3870944-Rhodomonas_salina.1
MISEIKGLRVEESKDRAARPNKRAKTHVQAGMALVATDLSSAVASINALSAQFQDSTSSAPPTWTRGDKVREEREKSRDNAKKNQFGTPKKGIIKDDERGRSCTPKGGYQSDDKNNTGELKDSTGTVIECDLCLKVGVPLPASSHSLHDCKKMREHVATMSAPTHQPHGNPASKTYVPPAGSTGQRVGFGNVAVTTPLPDPHAERTPALAGAQLAAAMFGANARSAAAFSYTVQTAPSDTAVPVTGNPASPEAVPVATPDGPSPLHAPRKRALGSPPESPLRMHPHSINGSFMPTMRTVFMALLVISVAYTWYSAAVGVSNVASAFAVSMSSMLLLNTSSLTLPQISLAQADKALAAFSDQ